MAQYPFDRSLYHTLLIYALWAETSVECECWALIAWQYGTSM